MIYMLALLLISGSRHIHHQHSYSHKIESKEATQQSEVTPLPAVIQPKSEFTGSDNTDNKQHKAIRWWYKPEWYSAATSFIVACVAVWGIREAKDSLRIVERQTMAIEEQAAHLLNSQRPFIMVEPHGSYVWMRNYGNSPADILFNSRLLIKYPEWSDGFQQFVMPQSPEYGLWYDDATVRMINIQWLAPRKRSLVGVFDSNSSISPLSETMKRELRISHRALYVFGVVRYRGLSHEPVYESRFCYRWTQERGLTMEGPPGYNQYT